MPWPGLPLAFHHATFLTELNTSVIIVTSGKGGTGTTGLSACLGFFLASRGKRVLLAKTGSDFAGMAGCLGADGGVPGPDGDGVCQNGKEGEEPAATPYKRLHCLAAPINWAFFKRQDLMEAFFSRTAAKLNADYIIVDVASGLAPGLAAMAGRLILCVLLVTPEPGAMQGGLLKVRRMVPAVPLAVVMNRWNRASDDKKVQVFLRLMEKYFSPPPKFAGGISFYPELFERVPGLGPAALLQNEALNREFSELATNLGATAEIAWQ